MNMFIGSDYGTALHHFAADHTNPMNLKFHLMALVLQLLANFALLSSLDDKLNAWLNPKSKGGDSVGWLSGGTAIVWSLYLISLTFLEEKFFDSYVEVPFVVRLCSCVCVFLGWQLGPLLRSRWVGIVGMQGVVTALAIETVVLKKAPLGITFFIALSAHLSVWHMITKQTEESSVGLWKQSSKSVIRAFLAVILLISMKTDPVSTVVLVGAFGAWPLALLCDEPALAFYGLGYLATASQGVAHAVSGEPATLIRLNAAAVAADAAETASLQALKVAYEWGHVTNFPNLLLHSCAKAFFPNSIPN